MKQAKQKTKKKTTKTVKEKTVIKPVESAAEEPTEVKKEPRKCRQYGTDIAGIWTRIKDDYIFRGISLRELSRQYNVPVATIHRHKEREHWEILQDEAKKGEEYLRMNMAKIVEQKLDNNAKAAAMIDELLEVTYKAIKRASALDPASLKQLTNCVKDLKDMGCFEYGVEETKNAVSVSFADDMEDFTE
jgi:hypothetical protein